MWQRERGQTGAKARYIFSVVVTDLKRETEREAFFPLLLFSCTWGHAVTFSKMGCKSDLCQSVTERPAQVSARRRGRPTGSAPSAGRGPDLQQRARGDVRGRLPIPSSSTQGNNKKTG